MMSSSRFPIQQPQQDQLQQEQQQYQQDVVNIDSSSSPLKPRKVFDFKNADGIFIDTSQRSSSNNNNNNKNKNNNNSNKNTCGSGGSDEYSNNTNGQGISASQNDSSSITTTGAIGDCCYYYDSTTTTSSTTTNSNIKKKPLIDPQQQQQQQSEAAAAACNGGSVQNKRINDGDDNNSNNNNNSEIDSFLTTKLSQLSMEERTKGIYELHGVADIEQETPEMWIRKMQEITQIANSVFAAEDTTAYRMAVSQNQEYVDYIKKLCLRAEYYDSQKAAARMISFFELKHSVFDDEEEESKDKNNTNNNILGRTVTLQDLNEEDMEVLKDGTFQLLSMRDRAGRAIIWMVGSKFQRHSLQSLIRVYIYVHMIALQDEETQLKGTVIVFYSMGQKTFYSNRPGKLSQILLLIPMRYVAFHICYDNPALHSFATMMAQAMEGHYLCRFRSHFGTHLDCIYSLMTFGIAQEVMPVDIATGEPDMKPFAQWMEIQKSIEAMGENENETPTTTMMMDNDNGFEYMQEDNDTETTDNNGVFQSPQEEEEEEEGQSLGSSSSPPPSSDSTTTTTTTTSINNNIQNNQNNNRIVIPGPMDIISGKGRRSNDSMGYIRFRTLLEDYQEQYDNAKKLDKRTIANQVRLQLQHWNCRLLKRMPQGHLLECDEMEALEKISHAFRNSRNMTEKKQRKSGSGGGNNTNNKQNKNNNANANGNAKQGKSNNNNKNKNAVMVVGRNVGIPKRMISSSEEESSPSLEMHF